MNIFEQHTVLVQVGGTPRPDGLVQAIHAMDRLAAGVSADDTGWTLKPGEASALLHRSACAQANFRFRDCRHDVPPVSDFVQAAEEAGFAVRVVTTDRETGNQLQTSLFIPGAMLGEDFRAVWEGESKIPMLDANALDAMLAAPGGAARVAAWCRVAQASAHRNLPALALPSAIEAQAA